MMRCTALSIFAFLLPAVQLNAQDRVILLDGSERRGKVTEITPHEILIESRNGREKISIGEAYFTEYANGLIERHNELRQTVVFSPAAESRGTVVTDIRDQNLVMVNTLALVNADFTVMYERLSRRGYLSLGVVGGLNFNRLAGIPNAFIAILPNGRKTHDAGLYLNFYPSRMRRKTDVWLGLMIKQTGFVYSKVREDTLAGGAANISYTTARDQQLAILFSLGSHTKLKDHFFVRTLCGFGGFSLSNEYRSQLVLRLQRTGAGQITGSFPVLPKLYFGISAGIGF